MAEWEKRRWERHCSVCGVKKETFDDRHGLCDACFPFALFWQGFVFGQVLCRLSEQHSAVFVSGRLCEGDFAVTAEPHKHDAVSLEEDTPTPMQNDTPTTLQCDTPTPTQNDTPTTLQCDTPTPTQNNTPIPLLVNTSTPPKDNTPTPLQNQSPSPDKSHTTTFLRRLLTFDFPEKMSVVKRDSSNNPATVPAGKHHGNPIQHGIEFNHSETCSADQMQVMPVTSNEDASDNSYDDNYEDRSPPTSAKVKHSCQSWTAPKSVGRVKASNDTHSNITHKTPPHNHPPILDHSQTPTSLRYLLTADFPEMVSLAKLDSSDSPANVSAGKDYDNPMQHGSELDKCKNHSTVQMQVMPFTSDEDDDDVGDDDDEDWTPSTSAIVKHSCQTRIPHKSVASVTVADVTNSNVTHKTSTVVCTLSSGKATSSSEITGSKSRQDWAEAWVESHSVCSEPRRLLKINAVPSLKGKAGTNTGRKATAVSRGSATGVKTARMIVKKTVTSEKKYEKCKFCGRMIFKRFFNRHLHFKHSDVTTKRLEKCQHCEVMLNVKNRLNLRRHLQVFHPVEYESAWRSVQVQCKICDQLIFKCSLPQHIQDFHSVDASSDPEAKVGSVGSFDQIEVELMAGQIPDVERVKCSLCDRLVAKSYLHKHTQRQHAEGVEKPTHFPRGGRGYKSKKCRKCGEIFDRDSDLQLHMTQQHEQEMLSCKVCSRQYPSQKGLSGHLMSAHGINSTECELCGKTFSGSRKMQFLERHRASAHKLLKYMCHICGKNFALRKSLKAHVEAHDRIKHYFCEVCGKAFLRESGLSHHRKTHDMKDSEGAESSDRMLQSRTVHVRRSGTERKGERGPCATCMAAKVTSDPCPRHGRPKPKEFICQVCGKDFGSARYLKNHSLQHKQPCFTCEHCGKQFSHKGTLKTHLDLHAGRSFQCDLCPKSFPRDKHLTRHKLRHASTSMSVECPICGRGLRRKHCLYAHIRTAHPETASNSQMQKPQ